MSESQDDLYRQASAEYGAALDRLARAYELDSDKRRDLLQEIHLALWRSFEHFEARCSLRTWVYRVAHNTAASHVMRQKRTNARLMSLKEIESMPELLAVLFIRHLEIRKMRHEMAALDDFRQDSIS